MYVAFGLAGLSAVVVGIALFMVAREEVLLDLHHRVTEGTVIGISTSLRGPGSVDVVYSADGREHTTSVGQSWWGGSVYTGDHVRIEYSPSHPSLARRAGAHDALSLVGGLAACTVAGVAFEGLRRRRRRRVTGGAGSRCGRPRAGRRPRR
ncbi:DUF3592 domain-containing protein [Actinoplanes sp. NPDC048796]|uniref:DUF3592 domain-containing protein n=1 Tax=Actinoplanes sp. NPDC048796 TaxID=3155640 RepID=UPI0033D6213B